MRFQQRLAHWSWARKFEAQGVFLKSDLPVSLLDGLADGGTEDRDSKMMEYIVSTVTDEKQSGRLGFSHRSFQEFLVAEHLRQLECSHPQFDVSQVSAALDDAVIAFLRECPNQGHLKNWYDSLAAARAPVSEAFLNLLLTNALACADLDRRLRQSAAQTYVDSNELEPQEIVMACLAALHLRHDLRGNEIRALLKELLLFDSPRRAGPALFLLFASEPDAVILSELVVDILVLRPLRLQVAARRSSRGSYYVDDAVFRLVKASLIEDPPARLNDNRERISPPPKVIFVDIDGLVNNAFQRFVRTIVESGPMFGELQGRKRHRLVLNESVLATLGVDVQFDEIRDIYLDISSPFGKKTRLNSARLAHSDGGRKPSK